jgi:hypothetical protein
MRITVTNENIADSLCRMNDWSFGASTVCIIYIYIYVYSVISY